MALFFFFCCCLEEKGQPRQWVGLSERTQPESDVLQPVKVTAHGGSGLIQVDVCKIHKNIHIITGDLMCTF